jgi:hypothetical protein
MTTRFATLMVRLIAVVLLGAALAGCSKCGWFWDDLAGKPGACRGDAPVN